MTRDEKRKQIETWYFQAGDYERGDNGMEQNLEKAFELYKKCAEYYDEDPSCSDAVSCLEEVGRFYFEGKGPVDQDYSEAKKWFDKTINANDFTYWAKLAKMYEEGLCVDVDLEKAAELYLRSEYIDDWEKAYAIYHSGRAVNPVREKEIRLKISREERDGRFYYNVINKPTLPAALAALGKAVHMPTFSKELYIDYFNSEFHSDLREFFDIRYDFGDCSYTFVMFVECFGNNNQSRLSMRWKGYEHYHMFSVSVFYIHTLAQVIGHLYGYRLMEDFLRSSGWPLVHCGAGGHMHPIQVMYEGELYPLCNRAESYINILNTSKDFIKEYFSYFLQGGASNVNQDAYTRLCNAVEIEKLLDDIDAITENYIQWINDPDSDYPLMLFDYPRD